MTTKAILKYGEFSLELEGNEPFVIAQLESFGAKIPAITIAPLPVAKAEGVDSADAESNPAIKVEKKTRRTQSRGSGPSCADRIRDLKPEDFFKQPQKATDIATRLEEKATPYEAKNIRAALVGLVQNGTLRRVKNEGVWTYVNP